MAEMQQRQKIPKDGFGPGGAPECYYTSRVLNSTARYVRFVKKLRALEEEQRRGNEIKLKELKETQISDFFISCDRRGLLNNVVHRVDLCMKSYEENLAEKRKRLIELYTREEEVNIRKLVEQTHAGAEEAWQDKVNRLKYLLDKRRKEHEDKFKDTPLSKCSHVLPCIIKLRAKEAQEIQLYQMREKQARKLAQKEFDKMWYEVVMKEADALAARMEVDIIERVRKDKECKRYTDYQLEQRRIQREKEKEMLKEQAKRFKALWDADLQKEEEAQQQKAEIRKKTALQRKQMIEERQELLLKRAEEAKLLQNTWDSLTGQGLADDKAKMELRRRKERDLDECNKKLIDLKKQYEERGNDIDGIIEKEAKAKQEEVDLKRCQYLSWSKKTNREVRKAMVDQIKEREEARVVLKQKMAEEDECQRQLSEQLRQLVQHKQLTDAQARKIHQNNLVEQIAYNKLLKERENLDEIKKSEQATKEYDEEIRRMLCRPFFSDEIHPFMKRIARGVQMRDKCPCSKPDYCT